MWFKVDDQMPEHRKFRKLRRSHPKKARDITPLALWVTAGAWSEDGFVPVETLLEWDDDAEALAGRLVDAGLWEEGDQAGEPGFWFHDWEDMNPVESSSVKGLKGAHQRWHVALGVPSDRCRLCREEGLIDANACDAYAPHDASHMRRICPDPTRPEIHTLIAPPTRIDEASTNEVDEDPFETWWTHYPRKIGKGQARKAWTRATTKTPTTTLIAAIQQQAPAWANTDTKYIPHPTTWLNGERWTDQPPTSTTRTPSGQRIDEDWSA